MKTCSAIELKNGTRECPIYRSVMIDFCRTKCGLKHINDKDLVLEQPSINTYVKYPTLSSLYNDGFFTAQQATALHARINALNIRIEKQKDMCKLYYDSFFTTEQKKKQKDLVWDVPAINQIY